MISTIQVDAMSYDLCIFGIAKCLGHGGVCKCLLKKLLNISEPGNVVGPLIVTQRLTLGIFCFPEDS